MATKKSGTSSTDSEKGRNQQTIEDRKKAREEATTQEGVTPPENQDINVPFDNPETAPS